MCMLAEEAWWDKVEVLDIQRELCFVFVITLCMYHQGRADANLHISQKL